MKKAVEAKFDSTTVEEKIKSIPLSDEDFQSLVTFFVTGNKDFGKSKTLSDKRLFPILFKKWQEDEFLQNFPVYFLKQDVEKVAIPLNDVLEDIHSAIGQNDENSTSNTIFKDFKFHVKAHLNGFNEEYLKTLWEKSIKSLLENIEIPEEKENTEKTLKSISNKLDLSGKVVSLSQTIPHTYFNTAIKKTWSKTINDLSDKVEMLEARLTGLLEADQLKSEGRLPKNLRSTVGDTYEDNLDFKALSNILEGSFVEVNLQKHRIERIKKIIARLISFKKYYSDLIDLSSGSKDLFEQKSKTLKSVKTEFEGYKKHVVDFFCAAQMAVLEIGNNYKENKHDQFFSNFHFSYLSEKDLLSIPPFPVFINEKHIHNNFHLLTEILETEFPIKILFEVNELSDLKKSDIHTLKTHNWVRRLVSLAINLNNVFILQSTTHNLPKIEKDIINGLHYKGPALFCIYNIPDNSFKDVDHGLIYNSVTYSRAFPSWIYSPYLEKNLVSRFDISQNRDAEKDWSKFDVVFKSDEMEFSQSAFTFLDNIVSDAQFSDKFVSFRAEYIHENIVPFEEYLSLANSDKKDKLPFLLLNDTSNYYYKVIPDAALLNACYACLQDWHTLQSLANIQGTAEEIEQETIKTEDVDEEAISKEEISKNVIHNILARLISGNLEGKSTPEQAPPVETGLSNKEIEQEKTPAEEPKAGLAEEEKKHSEIIEPYIDTPLCTSCNDCITLNSMMFSYDDNMQAFIKDVSKGSYKQLVMAAEKCPAEIIHPGKPKDLKEKDLDKLMKRAKKYNTT